MSLRIYGEFIYTHVCIYIYIYMIIYVYLMSLIQHSRILKAPETCGGWGKKRKGGLLQEGLELRVSVKARSVQRLGGGGPKF